MGYMAAQMDRQIEGAISENERLCQENDRLRTALDDVADVASSITAIVEWPDGTIEEVPMKQLVAHDPENHQYGDCFRTCIAYLVGCSSPDEVPHFYEDGPEYEEGQRRIDAWMAGRELSHISIPCFGSVPDVLEWMSKINPGVRFMLVGTSPRGVNHTVVAGDGMIEFDPSPAGGGLEGPAEDGYVWVEFLLPRGIHRSEPSEA